MLNRHELSVGELVHVLGQSQPRVSRHLKVLSDAGLVHRQREGTSAYYRLKRTGPHKAIIEAALGASVDTQAVAEANDTPAVLADDTLTQDTKRLRTVRNQRAQQAEDYFRAIAADWDSMRSLHVPDQAIEAAVLDAVADKKVHDLLDLGTGTGRMLEVLGPNAERAVGIDRSRDMLAVARHKLDRAQLRHCEVRFGDVHRLDLPDNSVDVAVIHHVLHYLDDPDQAIAEAARVLRPDGTLLIVDFAPHRVQELQNRYAHVRLGFATDDIAEWCHQCGLNSPAAQHFSPPNAKTAESLTVTMWTTTVSPARATDYPLEVAS
jgi:ArsR family transcriptional regulator